MKKLNNEDVPLFEAIRWHPCAAVKRSDYCHKQIMQSVTVKILREC